MDMNTKQTYEDLSEETQQNETNKEYEADITSHPQKLCESSSNYRLKQNKMNSHYTSQSNQRDRNQRDRNHSRSRSPNNTKNSKNWISSNAFINFIKDFRQTYGSTRNSKLLQEAGERWRQMSFEQKQPYVNAAMRIRNEKRLQKNKHINKLETNAESTKHGESIPKQEKVTKKLERNKKESKKSTKNKSNTESDTGSATSVTTGSVTSEDMSDSS